MIAKMTVIPAAAIGSAPRCWMVAAIVSQKKAMSSRPNSQKPSQLAQPTGRYLRVPTSVAAGA